MSGNDRTGEWGTKLTQESRNLRGSGRVALGIVSVLAITTVTLNSVEARHYRARVMTHGHDYSPPSSAIVVDANSGNVLYAASPDELRHPASLTKIMTLYLLFERLEAGKLKLDSQLSVSEHASAQAPTKLGLKPGHTIAVEDAIKGLVTKSANDAAVVVGEAIGGNESDFAEMMTKKARALGMSHTVYRNASGLPNDEQVTTARDQALLGRAIQERFPSQYRYFSTLSFTYHGESMRNHNMLLGHVEGVDGIKTGYTQASGFNLVTSVHRNNRRIVAVVLGGASAGARDAKMRSLIEAHIAAASTQHTAAAIAEVAGTKAATRTAAAKAPATYSVASFSPPTALPASKFVPVAPAENALTAAVNDAARAPAVAKPATPVEANDTIKPIHVKTIKVKLTPTQTAGLGPIVSPVRDEQAESGAQPAPLAVAAPSPKAPAPRAAAIAPPVAAPAAAPPVAAAPVPVTAPVAAAPVVAAPPVAAVDAPVAPASVAVPKTAPVAAHRGPDSNVGRCTTGRGSGDPGCDCPGSRTEDRGDSSFFLCPGNCADGRTGCTCLGHRIEDCCNGPFLLCPGGGADGRTGCTCLGHRTEDCCNGSFFRCPGSGANGRGASQGSARAGCRRSKRARTQARRGHPQRADTHGLDGSGRRLRRRTRCAAAAHQRPRQGRSRARQRRSLHRAGHEGRQDALPGPLCRLPTKRRGRRGLQATKT
jgi:D-alanyl-D-alanine carboxypeptidase